MKKTYIKPQMKAYLINIPNLMTTSPGGMEIVNDGDNITEESQFLGKEEKGWGMGW